ncbi:MAG: hypothetical protein LIP01_02075 [Tannerellaceae bacterium]|nr:hypothetical protein [Tannerellaceae bacterium]
MRNQIDIRINENGYIVTVSIDGKEYQEVYVLQSRGIITRTFGDFENESEIPAPVKEALDSFMMFECVLALNKLP